MRIWIHEKHWRIFNIYFGKCDKAAIKHIMCMYIFIEDFQATVKYI
jgi:hypothetical protein